MVLFEVCHVITPSLTHVGNTVGVRLFQVAAAGSHANMMVALLVGFVPSMMVCLRTWSYSRIGLVTAGPSVRICVQFVPLNSHVSWSGVSVRVLPSALYVWCMPPKRTMRSRVESYAAPASSRTEGALAV